MTFWPLVLIGAVMGFLSSVWAWYYDVPVWIQCIVGLTLAFMIGELMFGAPEPLPFKIL